MTARASVNARLVAGVGASRGFFRASHSPLYLIATAMINTADVYYIRNLISPAGRVVGVKPLGTCNHARRVENLRDNFLSDCLPAGAPLFVSLSAGACATFCPNIVFFSCFLLVRRSNRVLCAVCVAIVVKRRPRLRL